ncbi:MAG: 30S ribosome-binding factor RbfA [Pseudomonadota bacterium]
MKPPSQRQLRVGEQIRHALFEILQRESFHDPDLAEANMLTISEVKVSPDLKNATAYVSSLKDEGEEDMIKALNRVNRFIKKEVSRRVVLRYTPKIWFKNDPGFDYALDINTLLNDEQIQKDIKAAKAREAEENESRENEDGKA